MHISPGQMPAKAKSSDLFLPLLIAILTLTFWTAISQGLSLILTFALAMVVALFCYYKFTYPRNSNYAPLAPLYFFALGIQFLHFAEEFITGFHIRWPVEIFHAAPYDTNAFLLVNMVSYFFFTCAGIAMIKGIKFPLVIAWFFIIMGVCIQAVQHTIYALMVGGYFPGLYTSLVCYILGPILLSRMVKLSKQSHSSGGNNE